MNDQLLYAQFDPIKVSWTATAIAITAVLSVITLILLYSGLPIFGPINDLTNAVNGLLIALLAWQFHTLLRERASWMALLLLLLAWVGTSAIIINSLAGWLLFPLWCWLVGRMLRI